MKYFYSYLRISIILSSTVIMGGCSPSEAIIEVPRPSGFLLNKSTYILIDDIKGDDALKFKSELIQAMKKDASTKGQVLDSLPSQWNTMSDTSSRNVAIVRGSVKKLYEEKESSAGFGTNEKRYIEKNIMLAFEYSIVHLNTWDTISSGKSAFVETVKEEKKEESFLGSIFSGIVNAIISGDPWDDRRESVIRDFINKTKLHVSIVKVTLFSDKKMPELNAGIDLAKKKNWDGAIESFKAATEKYANDDNVHKAYYNLGVVYEYNKNFEDAILNLEKAYRISANPKYLEEINSCKSFEQEYSWQEKKPK